MTGVSFVDAQNGWIARGSEILSTVDGGHTWTLLYDTKARIHGIQRLGGDKGWYATEEGLFVTGDAGRTWSRLLDASFLYGQFQFVDELHGWVRLYREGLKATSDGGKRWSRVESPCKENGLFSFVNTATGWIVCPVGGGVGIEYKKIFRTDDGGRSWRLTSESGPNGGSMPLSSYSRDLFFLDSKNGWLSSAKGDILATKDGGRSWQALPRLGDLTEINAVQFLSPEKGYIITTKRSEEVSSLAITTNGGVTWTELYVSSV